MLKNIIFVAIIFLFFPVVWECATTPMPDRGRVNRESPPEGRPDSEKKETTPAAPERVNYGKGAYYSNTARGKITASGEAYDPAKLTAAHVSLPFGSVCRVTNMTNGRTVEVRINDRFSGTRDRIILISYEAANRLGAIQAGVINVKVEVLKTPKY